MMMIEIPPLKIAVLVLNKALVLKTAVPRLKLLAEVLALNVTTIAMIMMIVKMASSALVEFAVMFVMESPLPIIEFVADTVPAEAVIDVNAMEIFMVMVAIDVAKALNFVKANVCPFALNTIFVPTSDAFPDVPKVTNIMMVDACQFAVESIATNPVFAPVMVAVSPLALVIVMMIGLVNAVAPRAIPHVPMVIN